MGLLERVAEQISLTMERSSIVRDLRRSNEGLASSYNAMIEGLSRALELRDIETERHARLPSRPHIYYHKQYREAFEEKARLHLRQAITKLSD